MTTKLSILATLAAAVSVVAGVATASPVVTKQRIVVQSGSEGGFDTFELTPLSAGPVTRDTGSASACCWSRRFVRRDGQAIEIDDPLKTFAGQRGSFTYRAVVEWVDAGHGNTVGTGTWRVVSGTGAYARLEGHGRLAVLWPLNGPTSFRAEGFVDLNRSTRKVAAGGSRPSGTIAFVRWVIDGSRWDSHLFVIDPNGAGLRQLTRGTNVAALEPAWSPDGNRIVFTRRAKKTGSDVFVVDADGSGLRQLTHTGTASEPAWSPDGTKIAYVGSDGVSVMNADGRAPRLLTSHIGGRYPARSPRWSPDGRTIAFSTALGQIWTIDAGGSNQHRLSHAESYACPAWSPDGQKLAFVVMPGNYDKIFVLGLDGGAERLVTRHAYTESGFAWSPDGKQIVYAREKHEGVYSVGVDGTGDRRLTRNPLRRDLLAGGFSWSPNGRRIAYASDATGKGDIYVMKADGGGLRQLTSGPEIDGSPAWSQSAAAGSC